MFNKHGIKRGQAVFICQNPSFDRGFFSQLIPSYEQEKMNLPYHWLDFASMFFSIELFHNKKPWDVGFSKDKIARYLNLKEEVRPHRAINGVHHLLECFKQLISCYKSQM